ncbi:MAG: hypothetical protein KGM42_04220 [Hyphomicrobiales bacterium]|nr:hypothetical protein [Hyphomicrobiales bacterium]
MGEPQSERQHMKYCVFLTSLYTRSLPIVRSQTNKIFVLAAKLKRKYSPRSEKVAISPIDELLAAEVARLWRNILQASRDQIFEGAEEAIVDRWHGNDRLPQPGFVGLNYERGGLLLIGQNPGNDGVGKGLSRADQLQYQLLIRLRDAEDSEVVGAYTELMNALGSTVMPSWKIVRNVVYPLLRALDGQTLNHIAYTNLVKFRTVDSKFNRTIYDASWSATIDQINLLKPALIVALGAGTFNQLQRRYKGTVPIKKVRRQIGDSGLPAAGRSDIAEIAAFWRSRKRKAGEVFPTPPSPPAR